MDMMGMDGDQYYHCVIQTSGRTRVQEADTFLPTTKAASNIKRQEKTPMLPQGLRLISELHGRCQQRPLVVIKASPGGRSSNIKDVTQN